MAYLDFVKAKGRTYVYVREYVGSQNFTSRQDVKIHSLGRVERALITLKMWSIDDDLIPPSIKDEDKKNIDKWINSVRNRAVY